MVNMISILLLSLVILLNRDYSSVFAMISPQSRNNTIARAIYTSPIVELRESRVDTAIDSGLEEHGAQRYLIPVKTSTRDSNPVHAAMKELNKQRFSGLYEPTREVSEAFAGAFLVHRRRFLNPNTYNRLKLIWRRGIELAIFAFYNEGRNLMTRDFFDFQVIHLSSTVNQAPRLDDKVLQEELLDRMRKTVEVWENHYNKTMNTNPIRVTERRAMKNTVVLMPVTSAPGSMHLHDGIVKFNYEVRQLFLKATFYSVHRYFPRFIVTVLSERDRQYVEALGLPIWKIICFCDLKDGSLLPKESMLYVREKLKNSTTEPVVTNEDEIWKDINYVYYTESDQILHARGLVNIMNTIERSNGTVAVMPHRMQTMSLPRTFPDYKRLWESYHPSKMEALERVDLVIEDPINPKGSCCDDSRFKFRDCGNWWYNCDKYGLHNYTTWARFGKDGFTLPFGTEHQAKCKYSNARILCPIPPLCKRRTPRANENGCGEMPFATHGKQIP